MPSLLQCMDCKTEYAIDEVRYVCDHCGGLLDVIHDWDGITITQSLFDERLGSLEPPYNSGVWRYKELIYPDIDDSLIVSKPEGNTNLYPSPKLARWTGVDKLYLKHEGENPTGSFKDRGMTGGVTQARVLGMERVACASTGNTSAALASYAALADMEGIIFLQNKAIALGKLAQGLAYGATCLRIDADFDRNLELVREVSDRLGIYVLNSVNPFRLEGQKSIMFEAIQQLRWQAPDWIVCPGGNLGNSSAFGKALKELYDLGLIDRLPRIAIIQAEGASPLYESYLTGFEDYEPQKADTIATAIKIGNPVNYQKAVRAIKWTNGVVESVTDQQIMDAKALIDRSGIGCEPASACSVAGTRKLAEKGIIQPHETVVGILTGHVLKDPDATIGYHSNMLEDISATYPNKLLQAGDNIDEIIHLLEREKMPV
ncbi:threonine synthase [Phototrophicus methaneseepsis]|uniref:Threonine synthase n=1 Tax=Phototrophicus methaneseepsis TaxID=2710758 RepID=A0A7S8E5Z6_9CHLR|nr:threonine synthase [Phototrophicus methaneseepsis]QPC81011.1 threonine synthase [Phototrophicus methaneseepsis]